MPYKPDRNVEKMGILEKERFSEPYIEKLNGTHGISLSPSYFHGLTKNQKALALMGAAVVIGALCMGCSAPTEPSQPVVKTFKLISVDCENKTIQYTFEPHESGEYILTVDRRPETVERYCGCQGNCSK